MDDWGVPPRIGNPHMYYLWFCFMMYNLSYIVIGAVIPFLLAITGREPCETTTYVMRKPINLMAG